METLGLDATEQEQFFKGIAVILLLGNLKFAEDASGQAQFSEPSQLAPICALAAVAPAEFSAALLNPVIKAGSEIVAQGRDVAQVLQSIESLARGIYERLFTKLVGRINASIEAKQESSCFIGVLDIAGFEIFERNSFEQLCVNYTNEKLQQFFNHHMFTVEQEEYQKERVAWDYIDFGLDLQPTIDLIERANPIGVLACLDEDCVVPKATDKSYCDKLAGLWRGKSDSFNVTRFGDAFAIQHYAGRVEYSTAGWLEKNKDPLNENVLKLLMQSQDAFIASLFAEQPDDRRGAVKRGVFRTVAQKYRESLTLLMQQLHSTKPHFVRCIIPNEDKKPMVIAPHLVLDQLKCNGVLEGIRICRLGYPNRVPYADFCRLYEILAEAPLDGDKKLAARQLLQQLNWDPEAFRLGQSKVFFRAGELGRLDEQRDAKLSAILGQFQAHCRGALARKAKGRLVRQQDAKELLQRAVKSYVVLTQWDWWRLYCRVKPLLNVTRSENRIEELEDEVDRITEERDQQTAQLRGALEAERNKLLGAETARRDYERQLQQVEIQLAEANDAKKGFTERLSSAESEAQRTKAALASELEGARSELRAKVEAHLQREESLAADIAELRHQVATLKLAAEEFDFERSKLQSSEASLKARLADTEAALDDTRSGKKEAEAKLRSSEDERRRLVEKLEDDQLSLEKQQLLQAHFDTQLRAVQARHDEELASKTDELEVGRKRLQREIIQLNSELEQERRQAAAQRDTIRQYESGNDNLTNKLEAELRAQETWKREKDRLDARIKELARMNQEVSEREDVLQGTVFGLHEQLREMRGRISAAEDEAAGHEHTRRLLEAKLDKLTDSHTAASALLRDCEAKLATVQSKHEEALNRLNEEQDEAVALKEKLRATEHISRLHQHQAEDTQKALDESQAMLKKLEAQVKDLQLRLLDSDQAGSPISAHYAQLKAQIEAESEERQALLLESRRLTRSLQSAHHQLTDASTQRIALEESLAKHEIRYRKLQTKLDQTEQSLLECEGARRRAERECVEEREELERIQRELERTKARLAPVVL